MRIRFKKWAREELETSPFYINEPENYKNKWETAFENKNEIFLELGCGKGNFISQISKNIQDKNFIAIDLIDAMLGLAKRTVEVEYRIRTTTAKEEVEDEINKQKIVKNLKLTRYDITNINNIFGENDNIARIYINFCNPWPKAKHNKKRLTFVNQLEKYKKFLKGKIFFKTDNDELYNDSLEYFKNANYTILKKTHDLESEENFWEEHGNFETEHEKMYKNEGIKIKALIAEIN